jgi:hypothetical protein
MEIFVRMYVYAKDAIDISNNFLSIFNSITRSVSDQNFDPYWKFEDMYVIELKMQLLMDQNSKAFNDKLLIVAENWITFDDPVIELLASDTDKNCKIKIHGVNMINIHL